MDELVDILDEEGNFTGQTALKSVAHLEGLFHQTVHIWFCTSDGQLLLQQRGEKKDIHPLLWDVSVAGHIGTGEGIENAALREIEEEIGIAVAKADLFKIGLFKSVQQHTNGLLDCEFHHTFLSELNVSFKTLRPQETEVALLKLITLDDFSADVLEGKNPYAYVPHSRNYYRTVYTEVRNYLNSSTSD